MIATCNHEVVGGISTDIDEGQTSRDGYPAVTYGTYCADCMFKHFEAGAIENKEMNDFIMKIIKWVENEKIN